MIGALPFMRRQVRNLGVALAFVVVASGLWYWQERDVRERLDTAPLRREDFLCFGTTSGSSRCRSTVQRKSPC